MNIKALCSISAVICSIKKFVVPSSLAAMFFAGSVFSGAPEHWIHVPFVINVDATVTVSQDGIDLDSKEFTAGEMDVFSIYLGPMPVLHGAVGRQTPSPRLMSDSRGNVNLRLPQQPYQNAEVSLHTVNGRRVSSQKINVGTSSGLALSRSDVAPGVYILTVKGIGGNSYSSRLTHKGGRLNVNLSFGDSPALKKTSASNDAGDVYDIRVSSPGYEELSYSLTLVAGANKLQTLTLVAQGGTYTDNRSTTPQTYRIVEMPDGKTWFAENLNYYDPSWLNGVGGSVSVGTKASWCYNSSADSCAKYGRLYTWDAAMEACPTADGWRLPTGADWTALTDAVGSAPTAGTKLKSATGWYDGDSYYEPGDNEFGFSALPGGYRNTGGGFLNAGYRGVWWAATEYDADLAWGRVMGYDDESVGSYGDYYKNLALSVRCVAGD